MDNDISVLGKYFLVLNFFILFLLHNSKFKMFHLILIGYNVQQDKITITRFTKQKSRLFVFIFKYKSNFNDAVIKLISIC